MPDEGEFAKIAGEQCRNMSETKRDYETGYGKPRAGWRLQKGLSVNPRGPRDKSRGACRFSNPEKCG